MYIYQNLRHLREKSNLGQKDIGVLLEISPSQVSHIELGGSSLSIEKVLILSEYFNVSLEEFVLSDMSKAEALHKETKLISQTARPNNDFEFEEFIDIQVDSENLKKILSHIIQRIEKLEKRIKG